MLKKGRSADCVDARLWGWLEVGIMDVKVKNGPDNLVVLEKVVYL